MQPTFNETILGVKTISNDQFKNCVCSVQYQIICNYNNETKINMFDVELSAPSAGSFTDYQNLTQEQVLAWVQEAIGAEALESRKSAMVTMIDQIIAAKVDQPSETALPW